jgi:hypothetical protein
MVQMALYQLFACFGVYYYSLPLAQSFKGLFLNICFGKYLFDFVLFSLGYDFFEKSSFLSEETIRKAQQSRSNFLKREEETYINTITTLFSLINNKEKLHWRYELICLISLVLVSRPNHNFQSISMTEGMSYASMKGWLLSYFINSLSSQSSPLRFLS